MLFSAVAVITRHDGRPTLMFRAANQRTNRILEAQVTLTCARDEVTAEGAGDSALARAQGRARALAAVLADRGRVMHVIDEASPLHGATPESLRAEGGEIIVTIVGLDETLAQTIHARHLYRRRDILFGRRFADILTPRRGRRADGRLPPLPRHRGLRLRPAASFLSALGGGEGRGEVGTPERPTSPSHRCAMGPALSALKGGEGNRAGVVDKDRRGDFSARMLARPIVALPSLCSLCCRRTPARRRKLLNIYNWSDYIADDTVPRFEKETGIKVNYDVYDSNEVLEAKLLAGHSGYDLVVPSAAPYLARQAAAGVYLQDRQGEAEELRQSRSADSGRRRQCRSRQPIRRALSLGHHRLGYNVAKVKAALGADAPVDS